MTLAETTLEARWQSIRHQIQECWEGIPEAELEAARDNVDHLVDVIQQRTGEARDKIVELLEEFGADDSALSQAADKVKAYARAASENVQATAQRAGETVKAYHENTQEVIRRRPTESMAVCFGAGLITGVVVGLFLKS